MVKKMQKILVTVERSDSPLRGGNSPNILQSPLASPMSREPCFNNGQNCNLKNSKSILSPLLSERSSPQTSPSLNQKTPKNCISNQHLQKNDSLPSFIHNGTSDRRTKDHPVNGGLYRSQASITLQKASLTKRINRRVQNINHLNNVMNIGNSLICRNQSIVESPENGRDKISDTMSPSTPGCRQRPLRRLDAMGSSVSGPSQEGVKSPRFGDFIRLFISYIKPIQSSRANNYLGFYFCCFYDYHVNKSSICCLLMIFMLTEISTFAV